MRYLRFISRLALAVVVVETAISFPPSEVTLWFAVALACLALAAASFEHETNGVSKVLLRTLLMLVPVVFFNALFAGLMPAITSLERLPSHALSQLFLGALSMFVLLAHTPGLPAGVRGAESRAPELG